MTELLKSFKTLITPLSAFFLGSLFMSCAFGLLSTILALRLTQNSVSTFHSGIILSVYYLGYIFASTSSYKIINKAGHIKAFGVYTSILSALVLGHSLTPNPYIWGLLRLAEGYCLGSAIICLESWLNTRSNNKNRGTIMSLYMVTSYLGASLGQLMLNIHTDYAFVIYVVISIFFSIALVPISLTALPSPSIAVYKNITLSKIYSISPVGTIGCIVSGVFVGSFYTLGTIYAQNIGLNIEKTSLFMFFGILGGMLAQIPLGKLSDKVDRRFILMYICSILFFIAPWVHVLIDDSISHLIIGALMLGICTFTLYPISISHVNDLIEDDERIHASGRLISLQSIGMILGPIIISYTMQKYGAIWFLLSFSIVCGAYVIFAFNHITFKPRLKYINPTPTTPTPFAPTHAYNEITKKDSLLDKAIDMITNKKI